MGKTAKQIARDHKKYIKAVKELIKDALGDSAKGGTLDGINNRVQDYLGW